MASWIRRATSLSCSGRLWCKSGLFEHLKLLDDGIHLVSGLVCLQLGALVAVGALLGQLKLRLPEFADQVLQPGDVRLVILVQLSIPLFKSSHLALHS